MICLIKMLIEQRLDCFRLWCVPSKITEYQTQEVRRNNKDMSKVY